MVWTEIIIGKCKDLNILRNGSFMAQRHADKFPKHHPLPYAAVIGYSFLLMQNNERPHKIHLAKTFLEAKTMQSMEWSACSSYLSSTELA